MILRADSRIPGRRRRILLVAAMLLLVAVAAGFYFRHLEQLENAEKLAFDSSAGIDVLESVEIGGIPQWIGIRGHDLSNPVLLFLHGGPGSSMTPFLHVYQPAWESDFTVVNWDQRGAGRTHRSNGANADFPMNIRQFVSDGLEVVEYIRRRLGQEKILLLGHSWGSVLGTILIQEHPEFFHAYIGVGQVVNILENERVSYRFTMEEARRRNDQKAIETLEEIGKPPYSGTASEIRGKLSRQRLILTKYGGSIHGADSSLPLLAIAASAPGHSLLDLAWWLHGLFFSSRLMPEIVDIDLRTLGREFEVPLFLFTGHHDYQTPFEISQEWFEGLEAPHKEWVFFEDAAHMVPLEMPEEFARQLVSRVRPVAVAGAGQRVPGGSTRSGISPADGLP